MRYNVTIKEVLARSLQVEADSVSEAESAVKRLYRNSDVVLSADDLPPENPIFVADESGMDYGVPWLDCSFCSIR